jgi:hypothetical protein
MCYLLVSKLVLEPSVIMRIVPWLGKASGYCGGS